MGEPIRDEVMPLDQIASCGPAEIDDPFQPYKVERYDDGLRYDTIQVHGGHRPDRETHARAVPIYNSVSFVFTDSAHAKRACAMEGAGYFYSRISNPTVAVFEKRSASLEGGTAAVATATGQAAIFNTIICLAGAGDNTLLPRLGISVKWAKKETREEFADLIDEKTKMVFVESIGNPRCSIPDLRDLADLAHENNIPFVVDNTFGACGVWCRPIEFGADIILHSATKWMGGHGTTVGGVIIDCGTFDWGKAADRFPQFMKKEGPMSFSYWSAFGNITFAMAMRIDILMEVGSTLAPASAQQLLIGMETLSLRCEKHAKNTIEVARFLESHPRIAWVNYPGLEQNQYHQNAKKYLRNGYGGVLAFGPKGGDVASKMLMNYVKVISHQTKQVHRIAFLRSKLTAFVPVWEIQRLWQHTHGTLRMLLCQKRTDVRRELPRPLSGFRWELKIIVNAHDEMLESKIMRGSQKASRQKLISV
ncbi:Homocysteine synthase [Colletotrichum orbiculare MAFF 240422]|uniref:Homocysteine synthase n=1 Tax=Colletotrichum orbiculare (strain 104-T / ATCC 96160 / CBS 514.97 / LARS 414 / MAFF 240422) TaxID=1213857 RepID=A0A484F6Y7_COLOR|nr:Homocysteine synthase [Colletotrichum orbiculare MAFF 240422]